MAANSISLTSTSKDKPIPQIPGDDFAERDLNHDWRPSDHHEDKPLLRKQRLSPGSRLGWRPRELGAGFQFTFAASCLVLALFLASLYALSSKRQGLAKGQQQWHYVFKYGPTAVLTLYAALWNKVEYRTKQLAPWCALTKGWTSAEQGVLLDYLSSWNVLVLPRAMASRHYAVAISISVSLIIKLLIVISTGLFVSQDKIFEQHSNIPTKTFRVPEGFTGTDVDSLSYLNLQSIKATEPSFPLGTTAENAFQPYAVPENILLGQPTIDATVDIFSSDLTCEASEQSDFNSGYGEASTPGCKVSWTSMSQQILGSVILMQPISCNDPATEKEDAQRFLICVLDGQMVQEPAGVGGDFGEAGCGPGCRVEAVNITCLVCSPRYSITTGDVVMNKHTVTAVTIPENATHRQITGLSPWQMGMAVFQSLGSTPPTNYLGSAIEDLVHGNSGFESLLKITSPEAISDFTILYDPDVLQNVSRKGFRSLGAQVAQLHFTSPANESTVQVNYKAFESRLLVQPAIFTAMEVCLLVIVGLSLLLTFFTAQSRVISRDPSSILGLATIVSRSPELISSLKSTGHVSLRRLGDQLAPKFYRTTAVEHETSESFKIITLFSGTESTEEHALRNPPHSNHGLISWRPFPLTWLGNIALHLVPIVLIAIMLGLLLKSKHSQGIADLPVKTSMVHYGWTLFPAAVFLAVKVLFGALDSAISTMQPYYVLSNRCASQEQQADSKDQNELLTPQKLWYGIRNGHLAVASSAFAAICAPFLTILVSGLFSPGTAISQQSGLIANTTGWFDAAIVPVQGGGTLDNSDPLMITRIMYSNASFPQWTYSELALAEIALDPGIVENITSAHNATSIPSQVSIEVPALRAVMNCTTHPYTSAGTAFVVFTSHFDGSPASGLTDFEVNMTFPNGAFQLPGGWSYANGTLKTQWSSNGKPGIIGYWTPAIFGGGASTTTMGIFADVDAKGNPNNLTILTCMPYVETVQVNAVFYLPSFELAAPPTALENTTKFFNADSFWAMTPRNDETGTFDQVLQPVNLTKHSIFSGSDSFFQALFQGLDAVADPDSLLGPANTQNLIDATEHLYRMIMAQCLNTQQGRRVSVDGLKQVVPQPGPGTIRNPNGRRLYQSAIATYLLITLLAIMFVCALVTTFNFEPQGLLSKPPNSIAARAGLLVGSRLLEMVPPGAEWCNDEELKKEGVFDGVVMRLGWYEDGPNIIRYGIDGLDIR